ncbi:MAG: hypothetical protein ACOX9E_11360 [Lentisphaeria bacterium]|jgi:hypothetical protein
MAQKGVNDDRSDTVDIAYYIVAFIDILGQSKAMSEWKKLPKNEQERAEFLGVVKKSAGIYASVNTYVDIFLNTVMNQDNDSWKIIRAITGDIFENNIKRQRFSDGFILYSSLASPGGVQAVSNVRNIILACSAIMLTSLAAGTPIRAGVAIAPACELFKDELYGPAIATAYTLENSCAQYPRVVVDNSVCDYLKSYQNIQETSVVDRFVKKLALETLACISKDFDGYWIVDFLGDSVREIMYEANFDTKIFDKIINFTNQQLQQHRSNKDTKLTMRYFWLKEYINSRLSSREHG